MRYILAILLGLTTGLSQGISHKENFVIVKQLPHETVYILIAFGLIGGFAIGKSLLNNNSQPFGKLSKYIDRYLHFYTYMLVGVLSIAIPIFISTGLENIYASTLFYGYFFGSAGLGLVTAGIIKLASTKYP